MANICTNFGIYATGQIIIAVNGQILNSILAIWSHCLEFSSEVVLNHGHDNGRKTVPMIEIFCCLLG